MTSWQGQPITRTYEVTFVAIDGTGNALDLRVRKEIFGPNSVELPNFTVIIEGRRSIPQVSNLVTQQLTFTSAVAQTARVHSMANISNTLFGPALGYWEGPWFLKDPGHVRQHGYDLLVGYEDPQPESAALNNPYLAMYDGPSGALLIVDLDKNRLPLNPA